MSTVDNTNIVGTKTGPELVTELHTQIGNTDTELDLRPEAANNETIIGNWTFSGELNADDFKSTGIEDVSTGDVLLVGDDKLTVGKAADTFSTPFDISRAGNESELRIGGGGSEADGGSISLYGVAHSIYPGGVQFLSSGALVLHRESSFNRWNFIAHDVKTTGDVICAEVKLTDDIVMSERADHSSTPAAGFGYLWTKSTTPNTLIFTDDAGTDHDLTVGGGGSGTVTSVTAGAGMTQTGTSTINPTLNVIGGTGMTANADDIALDYVGTDNFIDSATNLEGTGINASDTIIYHDATDNNVKKGLVSDLPYGSGTGDILANGTIPMTANWDMGGFGISNVYFNNDLLTAPSQFYMGVMSLTQPAIFFDANDYLSYNRLDNDFGFYVNAQKELHYDSSETTWDFRTNNVKAAGDLVMTEKADHTSTPAAGFGYLWTKNTAPSTLIFTDDAGTDFTLGAAGNILADGTVPMTASWDMGGFGISNVGTINTSGVLTTPKRVSTEILALTRDVNDELITISGGSALNLGSYLSLYGSGGGEPLAMDIALGALGVPKLYYDHSEQHWDFQTTNITTTGDITGNVIESTETTGTAPFTVASTTVCSNLNADQVDGLDSTDLAQLATAQEFTKQHNFNASTLTDGASIAWNLDDNQVCSVTLAGNRALVNPTNLKDGATYILTVKQDATGSRTLSYGTAYKWEGGTAPVLSTGASAVDIITFVSDGTSMFGVIAKDFS